jgi:hypothetical protein
MVRLSTFGGGEVYITDRPGEVSGRTPCGHLAAALEGALIAAFGLTRRPSAGGWIGGGAFLVSWRRSEELNCGSMHRDQKQLFVPFCIAILKGRATL